MASDSDPKTIVTSYITALSEEDFKTARSYLDDNLSFQAPIAAYDNADAYFAGNEQLREKFGVRPTYEIKKVFVDGNDACVFYELHPGSLTLSVCAWFKINNGKITSIKVVFDPRPLLELSAKN